LLPNPFVFVFVFVFVFYSINYFVFVGGDYYKTHSFIDGVVFLPFLLQQPQLKLKPPCLSLPFLFSSLNILLFVQKKKKKFSTKANQKPHVRFV